MGILSRMLTLWKADLHGVMDQIEDKPLLLKQYLREMEETLRGKEAQLARLAQAQKQMSDDVDLREGELAGLEKDIDVAVCMQKDEIAKMLIRKRRAQHSICEQGRRRIDALAREHQFLIQTLDHQRRQYDQLRIKVQAVCLLEDLPRGEGGSICPQGPLSRPSEEEIELELIQRKEALRQGGAA